MTNEVTTPTNAGFSTTLVDEMRKVIGDQFTLRALVPLAGLGHVVKVPVFDDIGDLNGLITLAPGRYPLVRNIPDLYAKASRWGVNINDPQVIQFIVKSAELVFDADLCSLFDNLSAVKGMSGAPLTANTIYQAIADLTLAGVMPYEHVVCVLHHKQRAELCDEFRRNANTLVWEDIDPEMMARKGSRFIGRWNNVDFYSSAAVTTDDTDYFGALFKVGCFKYASLDPKILMDQNPSRQIVVVGDVIFIESKRCDLNTPEELNIYMCYSIGEVQDHMGVVIRSGIQK